MHQASQLRITDVKQLQLLTLAEVGSLEPAWDPGGLLHFQKGGGSVIEIHTDADIVGIGPGVHPQFLPLFKQHLIGKDPFAIEQRISELVYYVSAPRYQGTACIDIALWDLVGKACGQPLYKLFGGFKEKVPAYASMVELSTAEKRAELATQLAEEGWQALKLRLHHETIKEDIAVVEAVRDAVGDSMEIMVDANQAQSEGNWQPGVLWDYRRALETAHELEKLNCYWLEEPLPRFAFDQLAQLNREVALPIAGGENNRGIHEFLVMLQKGVYDVLQPEGMVMEGITSLRKVATLAEVYGKKITPHHGGRNLGTIAHLHLIAAWPHATYLEMLHDPPTGSYEYGFSILQDPPVVDSEGFIQVPQGPGLGVEINQELVVSD